MTSRRAGGRESSLGVITASSAHCHEGNVYIHVSTGRVVDELAKHFEKVYLCVPIADGPPRASTDLAIQARNVEVIPQPFYRGRLDGLKHCWGITRALFRTCRATQHVFTRGGSGLGLLLASLFHRCRMCYWQVGNPVALLRSHQRSGRLTDALGLAYCWQERAITRLARRLTGGTFICNGQELGEAYKSPRTVVTASSTVTDTEFFVREDTCAGPGIRLLYVGYIRPEKGVQYLLEAVNRLETARPWELVLVGPSDKYQAYRAQLDEIVARNGISDRVRWEGYVSFGEPIFRHMREADVLVLPSLSEGTPHVLVEAQANSLPVVATNVGGIPTTITDGVSGLLVPPKSAEALAAAIDRVLDDGELRRSLIRRGREAARAVTVHRFADLVVEALKPEGKRFETSP